MKSEVDCILGGNTSYIAFSLYGNESFAVLNSRGKVIKTAETIIAHIDRNEAINFAAKLLKKAEELRIYDEENKKWNDEQKEIDEEYIRRTQK